MLWSQARGCLPLPGGLPVPLTGPSRKMQKAVIFWAQMAIPNPSSSKMHVHGWVIKADLLKAVSWAESKERQRMHKTPTV